MNLFKMVILFLLVAIPAWGEEAVSFEAQVKTGEITGQVELGKVQIEALDMINLTAQKDGNQITVQAVQTDGTVVGKAETIIGLDETPLYVMTPKGLKQLIIHWKTDRQ